MWTGLKLALVLATVMACVSPVIAQTGRWRPFTSRTGWTVAYPDDWTTESCHTCSDPTAKGVYVDFFPPHEWEKGGWVMVSPLGSRPAGASSDSWLAELSTSANQNPHVSEKRLTVGGHPALMVRYRTSEGTFMDEVYVVSGSRAFSIGFSGQGDPQPAKLDNYPVFEKMVQSFRIQNP